MPNYFYKARDKKGNLVQNNIVSDNETLAVALLAEKGLWVVEIEENKVKKKTLLDFELDSIFGGLTGVGLKDLVVFCRQYSALVNSGVAMMRSLTIMAAQAENPLLIKILNEVKSDVEQGVSLSDSFAKHPKTFDVLFISMVKAGETGGVLDDVLNRIAKFMEDRSRLEDKIKSALAYPTIVSVFAMIIFYVMLTLVLPQFAGIFQKLGSDLPAYTQFLIGISDFLKSPASFLLFVFLGCSFFGFKKLYSIPIIHFKVDKFILKIPIFGTLLKKLAVARFTRTLGTLVKSGVPILSSLEIVEESSGNAYIASIIKAVSEEVKQGGLISTQLEKSQAFPPMVVSMISVGEETGELDSMMEKIADFYDQEVETAVAALTSMIEPIMMIFLGGMVGAVIVGMYLPMFAIFEHIK